VEIATFWRTFHLPSLHCQEISIYAFPQKELRRLSPNFHIFYVSVSDLYIPKISPSIFLPQADRS
jgi:hypothetical protein